MSRSGYLKDRSESPGPGEYENTKKIIGKDSFRATILGKPRDDNERDSPGPGYYEGDPNKLKDKVRTFEMGKSR